MALFYLIKYSPDDTFPFTPDISLAYLAAAVKEAGHSCKVFDYNPLTWDKEWLFRSIATDVPDVIGFKVVDSLDLLHSIDLAKVSKKLSPSSLIIAGGPHITLCDEAIFKVTDAFDLLVIGEGEMALVELGEYLEGERGLMDVRNIVFRENSSIIKTEIRPIDDLNSLPLPDWGLFDLESYFPILKISMQRGCPFHCSFCVSDHLWGGVRRRHLDSILEEIDIMMERYGVTSFSITDPTPNPDLLTGISEHIERNSLPFRWYSYGHVGILRKIHYKKLARGGCRTLIYGIESGDPKILKMIGKGFSPDDVTPSFSYAQEEGIRVLASFIIGFPGETKESLRKTIQLISNSHPDEFSLDPFKLQPGSPIALNPDRYGVRLDPQFKERYALGRKDYWMMDRVPGDLWISFWWNRLFKYMGRLDISRMNLSLHYTGLLAPLIGIKEKEFLKEWNSIWNGNRSDLRAIKRLISRCWEGVFNA